MHIRIIKTHSIPELKESNPFILLIRKKCVNENTENRTATKYTAFFTNAEGIAYTKKIEKKINSSTVKTAKITYTPKT